MMAEMDTLMAKMDTMSVSNTKPRGFDEVKGSKIASDVLSDYLRSPVHEDLCTVPGIGPASARVMTDAGITNTFQLLGKFLLLRQNGDTSQQHCDRFFSWLEGHGTSKAHRHKVTLALAEKLNTFMPGLYVAAQQVGVQPPIVD